MFHFLFRLMLLLALPSLAFPDRASNVAQAHIPKNVPFTLSGIFQLLEDIENGNTSKYDEDEIAPFLCFLARQGVDPNDTEKVEQLNEDITDLLSTPEWWQMISGRCWFKKQWDKSCKFVDKHKAEVIIGTVIIVGVTAAVVTCGASTVAAYAVGGVVGVAGASLLGDDEHDPEMNRYVATPKQEIVENTQEKSRFQIEKEKWAMRDELIQQVVKDNVIAFNDQFSEELNPSYFRNEAELEARATELSSYLAHEIIDEIDQLAREGTWGDQARGFGSHLTHKLVDEVGDWYSILPKTVDFVEHLAVDQTELNRPSTGELYDGLIAESHDVVDRIFDTDQARRYNDRQPSEFSDLDINVSYCMMPPPGGLNKVPRRANNVCGWKKGQEINNRTLKGSDPKWNTVRSRHWKNRAEEAKKDPNHKYSKHIERMEKGLAPQRVNEETGKIESMELHHNPPQRDGGKFEFVEVWPDEHARIDSHRHTGKK